MSKRRDVTFDFSGTDESLRKTLRQYTADKALMRINLETVKLLENADNKNYSPGCRQYKFPYHKIGGVTQCRSVFVTGWILQNLAYHVIVYTSDYRGKVISSDQELAMLACLEDAHYQRWEHGLLEELHKSPNGDTDLKFYYWGFVGEQYKYQELAKCLDNSARELYIMFVCRHQTDSDIDIERIVKNETGIEWLNVISFLFLAWFASTQSPYLMDIEDKIHWDDSFSYENYKAILSRYTQTYSMIKNDESNLGRQLLLIKPFIKTQKKDLISVNVFLNLFLFEHSILWIVRDYYNKSNDRKFTSDFGKYFEVYFRDLLNTYLDDTMFCKIPETTSKKADWKIQIGEYCFLVEQKSSVLSILAKQQESSIDVLKNYCKINLVRALSQLKQTENEFADEKFIKIVILYEDYLKAEVLDDIFNLPECNVDNDSYYWLMTICEFEKLMCFYSEDSNGFFDLIREKIQLEENKSNDGRSIEFLLNKRGITENKYLKRKEIAYYQDLVINNLKKHLLTNTLFE